MAAQLQGLLIAAILASACAGAPSRPAPAPPADRAAAPVAPHPPVELVPAVPPPLDGLGPEILLPPADAADEEVARVGDLVLRQSHAFARLSSAHPNLALTAVDLLVFDVLVARHAEQYGIRVQPERIEQLAAQEEAGMRRQVAAELGPELDFAAYVWRLFGMRLPDWQRTLRLRTAQRLYQGYVLRYLGLREDRVQVRFLCHKDEAVVRDAAEKVRAGADFGTLALRWSEDASRRDGGLLPAFGKGFQHPVAEVALQLERGAVSAPFRARHGDVERWFVVYCVERKPGRDVPFAVVQEEIDRDLVANPLTPAETAGYTLRWRTALERGAAAAGEADK